MTNSISFPTISSGKILWFRRFKAYFYCN